MIKKNNNRKISIREPSSDDLLTTSSILGGKKQLQSYLRVIVTATDKKKVSLRVFSIQALKFSLIIRFIKFLGKSSYSSLL